MTEKIDGTVLPGADAKRVEAAKGKQQPKPDPALVDPDKTPGSGLTPDNGEAPSG